MFRIGLWVWAVALAMLAGCANTAAKRSDTGLDLDLATAGTQGFVILKVVATRPISLLNPKWQSIHISAGGKRDEMLDITPRYNMLMGRHIPTESLYFAKLDAGEYEVTGMGSIGPGPGLLMALMMGDRAAADRHLPHFKVEAGRLANLGTIVYVPEMENEQPARMFLLDGPIGKQAAQKALLAEANRADVPLTEGGGWAHLATVQTESAVLAQARPLVSMLNLQHSHQGLAAGSHLGQIFLRTGTQTWSRETLDSIGGIFSIAYSADGRTIAGSEYGEYFVKSGNGLWSSYRLAKENGRIAHIEPRADGSLIFVAGDLRQTRVWLKKSPDDRSEGPSKIASLDFPPDQVLSTAEEILLARNIPGFSREVTITRINKQTLNVSTQNENFWVAEWQYLPNGTVMLTRQNGLSLYLSRWMDNLRTLQHTETPGSVSTFWFDAERGLSLEAAAGFSTVNNILRHTSDAGRTWSQSGSSLVTRNFAGRIVYADANEVLVQGGHMLYSTTDQGRTWKRVSPFRPE